MTIDNLLTIKLFAEKYPAFPQGTLRAYVYYADHPQVEKEYVPNKNMREFKKHVLRRVGGKVLLKENAFFKWIESIHEED